MVIGQRGRDGRRVQRIAEKEIRNEPEPVQTRPRPTEVRLAPEIRFRNGRAAKRIVRVSRFSGFLKGLTRFYKIRL